MKIQEELKAPKSQFNKFGGYKYRSCEDILSAVKPLLAKYKRALIMEDSIENVGDRFYVMATAKLYDLDGKLVAQSYAFAREEESKKGMDGSQITGSASSYARKYALNGLFAIDDGIDADATNKGEEKQEDSSKDKPWFNDPDLDKFTAVAKQYGDAEGGLKVIRTKYKLSKAMEQKVRDLYVSLDTIGS